MHLPLEQTLLRLLQLPLSLLGSDEPIGSHAVASEAHFGHHRARPLDVNNLGNIAPYHDAPAVPGVLADLPDDCTVDQVNLLHRHGSRGPVTEDVKYILHLNATLDRARDIIQAADLPPSLAFLKTGYEYQLVPEDLTIIGRRELFNHGIRLALRYPTLSTDVVAATTVQRVIDSSHFFADGFFGLDTENVDFLTISDDPVSWLTPWKSCTKLNQAPPYQGPQTWAKKYLPPIADKLNDLVPGVGFSVDDAHGALYACPYDLAAGHEAPWCNVFTSREFSGLEYEIDLYLDGFTGHAKSDPGLVAGAIYVKKLIERLTNATGDAQPLYLEFAHDFSILLPLSTLGLHKDAAPLDPTHPSPHRKFKSSRLTPFAAQMVWERFTCQTSFQGPQVRLVLNDATLPLSFCQKSASDKMYGTCSLNNFVHANAFSLGVEYHNAVWNATCEIVH